MRVGVATDHGGFNLKEDLLTRLRAAGHEIVDFGAHALNEDDDYPALSPRCRGRRDRCSGVAICGSAPAPRLPQQVSEPRAGLHDHFSAGRASRTITSTSSAWAVDGGPAVAHLVQCSSPRSSVRPIGTCGASRKWRRWSDRKC